MNYLMLPTIKKKSGFTYLEALVALVMISVALIPASEALRTAVQAGNSQSVKMTTGTVAGQNAWKIEVSEDRAAANKMEQIVSSVTTLAGWDYLAANLSNTLTLRAAPISDAAGTPNRALVYTAWYRPNGVDLKDLMLVKVVIENSSTRLSTVISRPN